MTADRALKVMNWSVLALVVGALLFGLVSLTGCRTLGEFLDGKATVNKTTILLAIVVSAGIAGLIAGWAGIISGAGAGAATTWLSTTSSEDPGPFQPPPMPWYFDPMAFIRPIITWFCIAVALGLFFERSRSQTMQFLKDTFTGHPIIGVQRFLAAMGWLHSDPIPDKDKKQHAPEN